MIRYRKRRRVKIRFKLFLVLLAFSSLFVFCESRVGSLSENIVYDGAAKLFENSVNSEIESMLEDFHLLNTTYDEDGAIASVSVRADEANRFKAELVKRLGDRITGTNTLWVPIGNFFNVKMLNGIGFKIPVNVNYTGTVLAEFEDRLASAGMNQTQYSLNLAVSAVLHTNSVTYNQEIKLDTGYILAQTVIVGKVPQVNMTKS